MGGTWKLKRQSHVLLVFLHNFLKSKGTSFNVGPVGSCHSFIQCNNNDNNDNDNNNGESDSNNNDKNNIGALINDYYIRNKQARIIF